MSDLITSQMLSDWRANYGLDKRTPIKAMHWWQDNMDGKAPAGVVAALGLCIDEIERLRAELEREHMRLAACGVVALANTPESAAKARQMHDDYRSASCDDVARAVDRETALRAALVAAMAIVQQDRAAFALANIWSDGRMDNDDGDVLRRYDAVIAQADKALGMEG